MFNIDGPVFNFMYKAGKLIIATILWLICIVPVVTFVSSSSALYYVCVKSVKKDRGYVYREFFKSIKQSGIRGIVLGLIYEALITLLLFNLSVVKDNQTYILIYYILLFFIFVSLIYLIPVLSRFKLNIKDIVKFSLYLSIKHFFTTLVLTGGLALLIYIQIRFLPMVTILFMPGVGCYLSSYLLEKILRKYMNQETSEDEDAWYLE